MVEKPIRRVGIRKEADTVVKCDYLPRDIWPNRLSGSNPDFLHEYSKTARSLSGHRNRSFASMRGR
mgnify:FL=1